MAARHRSSSLLARRNAFDTLGALGIDYRRRRYRRHYLNTLSAASIPDRYSLPCSALFPFRATAGFDRNSCLLFPPPPPTRKTRPR